MTEYDSLYPEYGFARHKGYGTKVHIEAIKSTVHVLYTEEHLLKILYR